MEIKCPRGELDNWEEINPNTLTDKNKKNVTTI